MLLNTGVLICHQQLCQFLGGGGRMACIQCVMWTAISSSFHWVLQ
jgi:hypothetical protein